MLKSNLPTVHCRQEQGWGGHFSLHVSYRVIQGLRQLGKFNLFFSSVDVQIHFTRSSELIYTHNFRGDSFLRHCSSFVFLQTLDFSRL